MMNKNKFSLEQKFTNSKLQISKNFVYYMILPILILMISVILMCTVGFNTGVDFSDNNSIFKIYINNEETFEELQSYNYEIKKDYNAVYDKIKSVVSDNGVNIISYRTSSIDIEQYRVFGGQAIEVVYKNKLTGKDLLEENNSIRNQLISAFGYNDYQDAVSSISQKFGHESFNFSMEILAGVVLSLALVIVYMLLRRYRGCSFVMIIQVGLDLLLMLGMFLICRPVINMNVGIAVLLSFVLSVINSFLFINKVKENINSGKYDKMTNNEIADSVVKQSLYKKILLYALFVLLSLVFVIFPIQGVREVAIETIILLISSLYTTTFLLPSIWATLYKPSKNKK